MGQVFQAFADAEILRIVDRAFGAQAAAFLEILFEIHALVAHIQAGGHALSDQPSGKPARSRPGDLPLKK